MDCEQSSLSSSSSSSSSPSSASTPSTSSLAAFVVCAKFVFALATLPISFARLAALANMRVWWDLSCVRGFCPCCGNVFESIFYIWTVDEEEDIYEYTVAYNHSRLHGYCLRDSAYGYTPLSEFWHDAAPPPLHTTTGHHCVDDPLRDPFQYQ